MKIAIQNPRFLFEESSSRIHSYGFEFLRIFHPAIFLTNWSQIWSYTKRLRQLGLNPLSFKFLMSQGALNRHADVLICFNGDLADPSNCPTGHFQGLKIAHVGEFYKSPRKACQNLLDAGVDYLMGHGDHAKYSALFCQHFQPFCDKLLSVPIGFSQRFYKRRAFDSRVPRCLLPMQTPGPVCDPNDREACQDYYQYYSYQEVSFPWLAHLRAQFFEISHLLELHVEEDLLHGVSSINTCQRLNEYMMFAAEGGLLGYPCARVFEGVAAGAIMVAPEHGCFKDLGFEHGKNCLFHRPGDMQDFLQCITQGLRSIPDLSKMADEATHWVHASFSRDVIAKWLYESIYELAQSKVGARDLVFVPQPPQKT